MIDASAYAIAADFVCVLIGDYFFSFMPVTKWFCIIYALEPRLEFSFTLLIADVHV